MGLYLEPLTRATLADNLALVKSKWPRRRANAPGPGRNLEGGPDMAIVGARINGGRLSCLPALDRVELMVVQSDPADDPTSSGRHPGSCGFEESSR